MSDNGYQNFLLWMREVDADTFIECLGIAIGGDHHCADHIPERVLDNLTEALEEFKSFARQYQANKLLGNHAIR